MEVDPLSILFTLIRISAVILLIIFFMSLWSLFGTETKTNDLERFNVELFENIATSQLTFGKYVFDPYKLDDVTFRDENFPSFVRDCKYKYKFEIEDLKTGDTWTFGERAATEMSILNVYKNTRVYYAGIVRKNAEKNAPFYEDANTAKVTVTVSDTLTGRLSCAIEKAYKSKNTETVHVKECIDTADCIVFKRNVLDEKFACFYKNTAQNDYHWLDCKILPTEIKFIDIIETVNNLKNRGVDVDKPLLLTAYPLKPGVTADCDMLKNNPKDFEPGQNENTGTVQVCVTGLTAK